jgi:hypothetical protein
MSARLWILLPLLLATACATTPPPEATPASRPRASAHDDDATPPLPASPSPEATTPVVSQDAAPAGGGIRAAEPTSDAPFGDVGFHEVSEKDWQAGIRNKIATQEKIEPAAVLLSPGRLRAAFVRSPPVAPTKPGHRPPRRVHQIVVVDNQGQRVAAFRPVTAPGSDEPPKELTFLSEDRVVYEVVAPPPAPVQPHAPKAKSKSRPRAHHVVTKTLPKPKSFVSLAPEPPPRLFVIQPIAPRARPIRCQGFHFAFTRAHDRLVFVGGKTEAGFVSVDGTQVYPRGGRTIVASAPVWSKDGRSLAFLEVPATKPARLVLLAEVDNPTGDTTWDLPPTTPLDGAGVFWAGASKLVVGRTAMRPVFSAAFSKDAPAR